MTNECDVSKSKEHHWIKFGKFTVVCLWCGDKKRVKMEVLNAV